MQFKKNKKSLVYIFDTKFINIKSLNQNKTFVSIVFTIALVKLMIVFI